MGTNEEIRKIFEENFSAEERKEMLLNYQMSSDELLQELDCMGQIFARATEDEWEEDDQVHQHWRNLIFELSDRLQKVEKKEESKNKEIYTNIYPLIKECSIKLQKPAFAQYFFNFMRRKDMVKNGKVDLEHPYIKSFLLSVREKGVLPEDFYKANPEKKK